MLRTASLALALTLALVACGADAGGAAAGRPGHGEPPLVGFTFSPKSLPEGADPEAALATLLRRLAPDLVRLPVYWDAVAPEPDALDFAPVDRLLAVVAAYDAAQPRHHARVVLVAGARNVVTPEVHLPDWAEADTELRDLVASHPYRRYLLLTFRHYARDPLLYGWQVENEPLDSTNPDLGEVDLPASSVKDEVDLLRRIDPVHPIVVTTYDSAAIDLDQVRASSYEWLWDRLPFVSQPAGHPLDALALGDALGLDVYVVTPTTPLSDASPAKRIGWKAQALAYWAVRAEHGGKSLWITEMQAAPWRATSGFTTDDLLTSARVYRQTGAAVVLLWGVESGLSAPDWLSAGRTAVHTLRS